MHPTHRLGAWVDALVGREIGANRIEQGDFLMHQTEAVVRSLLVTYFPRSSSEADGDNLFPPFHFPDFDPANPLTPAVTATQRYAVRMLLAAKSRRAQDVEQEIFSWIRACFDRVLGNPELSYERCFEEVWQFLKRLYFCGRRRVIVDFHTTHLSWENNDEEKQRLRKFVKEVAQPDLLAAKPVALELMAFAACSCSFGGLGELSSMEEKHAQGDPTHNEELKYRLISRLASLGVPFAEDLLVAILLGRAEESGDCSRFDNACEKLAKVGNEAAQYYFADAFDEELDHGPQDARDLRRLEQKLNWLLKCCPIISCQLAAEALKKGRVGPLKIDLSAEERFDLLKRRFHAGDKFAGNSLLEVYTSNQIGNRSLNLSPLERVAAIEKLTEGPSSYLVRRMLTIIYNTNRIGEDALPFSLEERHGRIEALAQKGCTVAACIMLKAYLKDRFSLPGEVPSESFPPIEREMLPLYLTHQERFKKLYALALKGYAPAIGAVFDYLVEHRQEFDLQGIRPLLFELLMCRCRAKRAIQLLAINENQVKIIDLLGNFYISLFEERSYPFRF